MKILALTSDGQLLRQLLASEIAAGLELATERTLAAALQRLKEPAWSLVLVDSGLPDQDQVIEVVERIAASGQRVVLLARSVSVKLTLDALERDVWDILPFPVDGEQLRDVLARSKATDDVARPPVRRTGGASADAPVEPFIGESPTVAAVLKTVTRVADSTTTVLIQGESGTGKTLLARTLHEQSRRRDQPFVTVSCGLIPDQLLESELFGFEKGAFTGAVAGRAGSIERACGGTLFLDNVADMSLPLQAKVLRALKDRELERLGGNGHVSLDVRLVASTTRPLGQDVASGQFRADLRDLLSVVVLVLPPLRERGDDVRLLAEHCVTRGARDRRWQVETIADEALALLRKYPWPGNVRELCKVMERALFWAEGPVLLPAHLPAELRDYQSGSTAGPIERRSGAERRSSLDRRSGATAVPPLEALERDHIRRVLGFTGWRIGRAADLLGIHRNTLRRKLREWGLLPRVEPDVSDVNPGETNATEVRPETPPS